MAPVSVSASLPSWSLSLLPVTTAGATAECVGTFWRSQPSHLQVVVFKHHYWHSWPQRHVLTLLNGWDLFTRKHSMASDLGFWAGLRQLLPLWVACCTCYCLMPLRCHAHRMALISFNKHSSSRTKSGDPLNVLPIVYQMCLLKSDTFQKPLC